MSDATIAFCLPAHISPQQFLTEYWQKKPLLIKQGLPHLIGMFEPSDILELATDEDVSARLITQAENWTLTNSPLTKTDFQNLPALWTVLIQNMEQWSPELANLWHAFDFIPQWQRDDIMVSFAPTGGSVGKHYDDYDVFLAQGFGERRWQLGKWCDENTTFIKNQPIRIFDDMGEIIFDEILEAGDVLYVPPRLSHYGVAQNDCLTFSFGFRRPNLMQLFDNLADVSTHQDKLATPLFIHQPLHQAGKLDNESINDIKCQLIDFLNSSTGEQLIKQTICETVSKRQYDLMPVNDYVNPDEILTALQQGAVLSQDLASRIIYCDNPTQVFINGELLENLETSSLALLIRLANGENITIDDILQANIDIDDICEWIENSWVILQESDS